MPPQPVTAATIDYIIHWEGGEFSDDPVDHGGATKYGITIAFLSDRLGRTATVDDISGLTDAEARLQYLKWMQSTRLAELTNFPLCLAVTDYAVNSGLSRAVRTLQGLVNVTIDGKLGSLTLTAANGANGGQLRSGLCADRLERIGLIVHGDTSQAKFLRGWLNRVAGILRV